MSISLIHPASCHCGAVQFALTLPRGLKEPRRYQFSTMTAKHYFCSVCGIYTHHQRRSNPRQFGVNVACLEGMNPFDLGNVPVMDGINHPSDR